MESTTQIDVDAFEQEKAIDAERAAMTFKAAWLQKEVSADEKYLDDILKEFGSGEAASAEDVPEAPEASTGVLPFLTEAEPETVYLPKAAFSLTLKVTVPTVPE